MTHSKSFPGEARGNGLPRWEEVYLSLTEEQAEEDRARKENLSLMKQCLDDAGNVARAKNLQAYQSDIVALALALFGKRASHIVYWKDGRCKEKFDRARERPKAIPQEARRRS